MKKILLIAVFLLGTLVLAYTMGLRQGADQGGEAASDQEPAAAEPLYWVAPMDPNYRRDKPGKSPMGMDLVPVYADDAEAGDGADNSIRISPAVENNLGIRTEKVKVGPLWRRIEATAYVGPDETLISNVNTRTPGWISSLNIKAEGERVEQDDLLFELYSPEVVNAQKEYLQARKRGESRLISGSLEKLRALGLVESEIASLEKTGKVSESIRVLAPQDGVVTSLNVREGMYVQPDTISMSLTDLSSVWMQAEVFESQSEWVAAGQAAKATLDYLPGQEFNGQVDYVYPVLDPKTRTLRVRLRFENPGELLKPNMYARVSIYGKLHPNALSVSREALIRTEGSNRVVVALGDGRFAVNEVLTGLESGESVEILAGLDEGDVVVTSAQFLLDSEASLSGAIRRLGANPMPQERPALNTVLASGRVEAVYPDRRRLRITHGPIDALAWPAMTMEFDVLGGGILDTIRTGQNIRFSLQQQLAGDYAITDFAAESDRAPVADDMAEGAESRDQVARDPDVGGIFGTGIIIEIDRLARTLKLKHEPIAELGWPAMTMKFDVLDSVDLAPLEKGQSVRFELLRSGNGKPIGSLEILGDSRIAEPAAPPSDDGHGVMDHD